jgi:hypothetical protein
MTGEPPDAPRPGAPPGERAARRAHVNPMPDPTQTTSLYPPRRSAARMSVIRSAPVASTATA